MIPGSEGHGTHSKHIVPGSCPRERVGPLVDLSSPSIHKAKQRSQDRSLCHPIAGLPESNSPWHSLLPIRKVWSGQS